MSVFQESKIWLVDTIGLSKDALHVYVGLIVLFGMVIAFRLRLSDPRPLAAVLLAAIAGEIWDIFDTQMLGAPQTYDGNWHDIWNTMFWPTAVFLLARYTSVLKR